ncbi:putative trm112p-like protein [Neofusicoccum parvum UCRNP2]|uniref:Multifunctional methyltransferase subunit trm112 n=1 Tax=Botryosphaeria parva (strain UCR-NP2) TaxID=1287680 RepID=R1EP03_BOTPV|nr:putative trm112p-like protein [Neofusicoccum parvum UCRNP2]
MKLLTLNFLTCARKACKSSPAAFPLHPRDAELEVVETDLNPPFIRNILPRLEWEALRTLASELGLPTLPETAPEPEALGIATANAAEEVEEPNQTLKDLHTLLLETTISSGKLVCANCGHEYAVKEGIANFLLPSHLV